MEATSSRRAWELDGSNRRRHELPVDVEPIRRCIFAHDVCRLAADDGTEHGLQALHGERQRLRHVRQRHRAALVQQEDGGGLKGRALSPFRLVLSDRTSSFFFLSATKFAFPWSPFFLPFISPSVLLAPGEQRNVTLKADKLEEAGLGERVSLMFLRLIRCHSCCLVLKVGVIFIHLTSRDCLRASQ